MTDSPAATARQLTRHVTRASKRLTAAATTLTDARDEITAAVELLRANAYNHEEIVNEVTGEIVHLTVIATDLAGDEEYMDWPEAVTHLAEIVQGLAATLTEHGARVLAKVGESRQDAAARWRSEDVKAPRRTRTNAPAET